MKEEIIKTKIRTYTEEELQKLLGLPLNEEIIGIHEVLNIYEDDYIEIKTRMKKWIKK